MYNIYYNNVALSATRTSQKLKKIAEKVQDENIKKELIELRQETIFNYFFLGNVILCYHEYERDAFYYSPKEVVTQAEAYMKKVIKLAQRKIAKELTK